MGRSAADDGDFLQPGGALASMLGARALAAAQLLRGELAAGHRLGPYRILGTLGRGGSARVYLAERVDGELSLRVALKVLHDDEALEPLAAREREALSKLSHPGIARVIDGGVAADGIRWLAMEHVDGEPIDQWVRRQAPTWPELLRLLRELGDALAHSHQHFIAHGDLKPGNVLVDASGHVKVLDFGISGCSRGGSALLGLSPRYTSPEQQAGAPASATTDIYQLGLLIDDCVAAAPRLPAPVRRNLAEIAARCRAADVSARYPSVESLLRDLRATRQLRPVRSAYPRPGVVLAYFAYRHRRAVALGALLLVLGGWQLLQLQRALDGEAAARQRSAHTSANLAYLSAVLVQEAARSAGSDREQLARVLGERRDQLLANAHPDPLRQAELLRSIAIGLAEVGSHGDAAGLFQRSLDLVGAAPEARLLRAELACRLALSRHFSGAGSAAERAAAEARALLDGLPAPTTERYLADFCLGTTLTELGQNVAAETHLGYALAAAESGFGAASREYLDVLARWAELNRRLDRHAVAFAQQQQVVARMEGLYAGDNHLLLGERLRLERSRAWSGDPATAETNLRQLLPRIPTDDIATAYAAHSVRFTLGETLYFLGRLPESAQYYRQSLDYFVGGSDDPHFLGDSAALAMVTFWMGDSAGSGAALQQIIDAVARSSPDGKNPTLLVAMAQVLALGEPAQPARSAALADAAVAAQGDVPAGNLNRLIGLVVSAQARLAEGDLAGARERLAAPLPPPPEGRLHEYAIWQIRHALLIAEMGADAPFPPQDLATIERMFAAIPPPLGPDHPLALIARLDWLRLLAREHPQRAATEAATLHAQLRPTQLPGSHWLARAAALRATTAD